jgi:hypothetical protein
MVVESQAQVTTQYFINKLRPQTKICGKFLQWLNSILVHSDGTSVLFVGKIITQSFKGFNRVSAFFMYLFHGCMGIIGPNNHSITFAMNLATKRNFLGLYKVKIFLSTL